MTSSDLPVKAITYKLKELRNRFHDAGDDTGVILCQSLAEDLNIETNAQQQDSEE